MGTGGPSLLITPTISVFCFCVSIDLSSRAVASQVFSAQMSLTAVFGMGTGGPSSLMTLTSMVHLQGFEPRDASRSHLIKMAVALATALSIFMGVLVHLQGFEPGTH